VNRPAGPYLSDLPVLYQENIRLATELVWAEAKLEDIADVVARSLSTSALEVIEAILNRKEPNV
jgi:hypothetical protein